LHDIQGYCPFNELLLRRANFNVIYTSNRCTKVAKIMARVFDADQVADSLSDFETKAYDSESHDSNSHDNNSSEDDASIDDSDARASESDSSLSLEGVSGDDGDSSRDDISTNGCRGRARGRVRERGRGRAGVRRGRGGRGATGRRGRAGTGNLYAWTTVVFFKGTTHY
jgi:hypothetical protein